MSLCEGSQQLLLSENADTLPSLLSADSTWHSMKKEHRGAHTKQTNKLKKKIQVKIYLIIIGSAYCY